MSAKFHSIPPERLRAAVTARHAALAERSFAGAMAASPLYGRWETEDGHGLGEPIALAPPEEVILEHPDGDGGFGASLVQMPLAFVSEPPEAASHFALSTDAGPVARFGLTALAGQEVDRGAPRMADVGPETMRFTFPVIAERFDRWEAFLARAQELRDWIVSQPPFDDQAIGDAFGLKAIFWPSDPQTGMFGADDSRAPPDGQLFYGNLELAKRLIDPWLGNNRGPSLILINSAFRGGAGGSPGYSAWASTAAAAGEAWQAIGLHEIGHAFGLGDEYVQASRAGQFPAHVEPNISRDPRAGAAPWRARITVPPDAAPSNDLLHQDAAPDVVGTFQGARYRDDLYRPSADCLMRHTSAQFCVICQDHIRTTI